MPPDTTPATMPGRQVVAALLEVFGALVDPRCVRGIRHELASVSTITVLAVLAGRVTSGRLVIGPELPTDLLLAAGARISPVTGAPEAPSAATISRIVADIDAGHADARVGAWRAGCVAAYRARHRYQPGVPDGPSCARSGSPTPPASTSP